MTSNVDASVSIKPKSKRKPHRNHFVQGNFRILGLKWGFRAISKLSPDLGAQAALRVFLTPPRLTADKTGMQGLPEPDVRHVTCGERVVAVYSWGQGSPVLLVHGWGLRATEMAHFVRPLLERGHRVIAFDGPSHGASPGKRIDFMAFAAAIAQLSPEPLAAIVAHSYGAACALIALKRYGLQAKRLVLLGCPASAVWITEDFARRLTIPSSVVTRMRELLVSKRGGDWTWEEVGAEQLMASVGTPTLLVHDRDDVIIPYEHALRISEGRGNIELVSVSGLGHRRMLRDAATIARCVEHAVGPAPLAQS